MPERRLAARITTCRPLVAAGRRRRALLGGRGHPARRRSASGEGRGLRRARHDAAALRHADHLAAPCRLHRRISRPAGWLRSATAFTAASSPDGSAPTIARNSRRCSKAANGTGSAAITILICPTAIGGFVCPSLIDRRHHPAPRALAQPRPRRSPAICTRWRALPGAGRGDQAQMLRHRRPPPGDAGLRRLCRRAQRARRGLLVACSTGICARPG